MVGGKPVIVRTAYAKRDYKEGWFVQAFWQLRSDRQLRLIGFAPDSVGAQVVLAAVQAVRLTE